MDEKVIDNKKCTSLIPKGTVLSDSKRQRWIVGDSLDIDGFRDIYAVASYDDKMRNYTAAAIFKTLDYDPQFVVDISDLSNQSKMISDICNPKSIEEWKRQRNLEHLGVTPILGLGSYTSHDKFYSYMITMRYAENIQQLLKNNKKGFILPTIYKVIGQMIHVFEYIHSLGYYNIFCISSDKLLQSFTNPNNIYLDVIDYGKTPECLAFKSRDAQVGKACGDLESIMYMALDWMKLRLPWSNLTDDVTINMQKIKAFHNVDKFLKDVFDKFQVLAPVQHFMKELASTVNANQPDYGKIRLFMSNGVRNIGNINHNLDGGINFKAELNLRKNRVRYNKPVVKAASVNIPLHNLVGKAVDKNSMKKRKSSTVSKKKKKKKEKVKRSVLRSNCDRLQRYNNTKLDNVQKALSTAKKATSNSNSAEPMMNTVPVAESFTSAASLVPSATKSGIIPNDVSEATMTSGNPKLLLSIDKNAKVAPNVTITSAATTTSTEKLQHSETIEPEQRDTKRSSEKIEESAASSKCKRMKVTSREIHSGGTQEEEATEIALLEKEKQQQQLTTSSVISSITNGTCSNVTEENLARKNSDKPAACNARVDGSMQKDKVARAIQLRKMSEQVQVRKRMQDLQKNLENLENQLISRDFLRDIATKIPNAIDYMRAVTKRRSFYLKTFNLFRRQVMALESEAREQKIDVTELLNKSNDVAVCIEKFESELKSSLYKYCEQSFCQTKLASVEGDLQKMKPALVDINVLQDQSEKSKGLLSKEVVIKLVRSENVASFTADTGNRFSNEKSLEKNNERVTEHGRTQESKSKTCSKRRQDDDSYSNPSKKKGNDSPLRNERSQSPKKLQSPVRSQKSNSSVRNNDRTSSLISSKAGCQAKKNETSAGSTTLQNLMREDKESKQQEKEQPKKKSEDNVAQGREKQMGQKELNEKNVKLGKGLNHVEDSATRPNRDSHEIKQSLEKNASGEDLERVLRMLQRSDITLTRVQKKK